MLKQIKGSASGNLARIQVLSYARLSNYRSFFGAADDAQALGLYQWNDDLSAALFRTISQVEVVLRNRFHHAMSLRYGAVGGHGTRDWYAHVALGTHSRSKITDVTHYKRRHQLLPRVPAPSPDDVVSRLTFGFWPHLLDLKNDVHNRPVDWGPILVDVLPGHRQRQDTHWAKLKHRDALFARLDLCNELRNRIAHHEPIWKLGPLMDERRPRRGVPLNVQAPAPSTPSEALTRLQLLYGRVIELLAWLSPAVAAQYAASDMHLRCLNLLQPEVLEAYKRALPPAEIDLSKMGNLRTLRKALRYAARRKQPVLVKDGRRLIGHLTVGSGFLSAGISP
ncbi:Abi family protein [Paraburkholderia bannensis]|uniref:Abi family protein n=1 Tax=Paraburkholderia bannensis TaxID=765414 RepID=UPI002AB12909|nr:Abi family protein [Paraburkholderia bannensis]